MMMVVLVLVLVWRLITGHILPHPPKGRFPNAERALFRRRKGASVTFSGR